MNRRDTVATLVALVATGRTLVSLAQPAKVWRIGSLLACGDTGIRRFFPRRPETQPR